MWKSFSEAFLVCFSNQDLSSWFPVPYIQLPFGSFCLVYPTFWFIQNLNVSFFLQLLLFLLSVFWLEGEMTWECLLLRKWVIPGSCLFVSSVTVVFNKGDLAPLPPRHTWQCLQTVVGVTVGRGAVAIEGVEARHAAEQPLTPKNYLASNVNSAEVGKSWLIIVVQS